MAQVPDMMADPPKPIGKRTLAPGFLAQQFKKGQAPPGPGRPKSFATRIRERTNNCEDLIDILLEIAKGEVQCRAADRVAATRELLDRGIGKAVETSLQLQASLTGGASPLELAPETLEAIARILIPSLPSGPTSGTLERLDPGNPPEALPETAPDLLIDNQSSATSAHNFEASTPAAGGGGPVPGGVPGGELQVRNRAGDPNTIFPAQDRGPAQAPDTPEIFPEADRGVDSDPAAPPSEPDPVPDKQ